MAWTSPRTWATGEVVTAALLNVHLKDNLVDLDRRTSPYSSVVATSQTTTATTYSDLATPGPSVALLEIGSTGKALLAMHSGLANATAGIASFMGFEISGATTLAASDSTAIGFTSATSAVGIRCGSTLILTGLTPGATTFTAKYRMDPGVGPMTAVDRRLAVTPLGS